MYYTGILYIVTLYYPDPSYYNICGTYRPWMCGTWLNQAGFGSGEGPTTGHLQQLGTTRGSPLSAHSDLVRFGQQVQEVSQFRQVC